MIVETDDAALGRLPLLEFLPSDVRAKVARRFVRATDTVGAVIVREGDPADARYVLVSGRARVVKRGETGDEIPLNVLRAGDAFGDMALLERTTRLARVRASSAVEVLRLDRAAFDELLVSAPDLKKYLELQASHRRLPACTTSSAPTLPSHVSRWTRWRPCWPSWSR